MDIEIINKLLSIGFSENEAKIYLYLLKHPGENGTQISKNLEMSRSSTYTSLDNLEKRNILKIIPNDTDRKNYKAIRPSIYLNSRKKNIFDTIENLNEKLDQVYENYNFEDIYTFYNEENIIYILLDMIKLAEKEIIIYGSNSYVESNIKNISYNINIIKLNSRDEEFILLKDRNEVLIYNKEILYTRNKNIIKQVIDKLNLEME